MLHIKHLQCEWIDLNIISLQSLRIALWHWHFTIHVSFICAQCECTRACERVKKVHDKIQWFSRLDEFASVVYFLRVRRKKKYHSNFIGPCRLYLLPQFIHKLYNNAMFAMTSFIVCICVCVCVIDFHPLAHVSVLICLPRPFSWAPSKKSNHSSGQPITITVNIFLKFLCKDELYIEGRVYGGHKVR